MTIKPGDAVQELVYAAIAYAGVSKDAQELERAADRLDIATMAIRELIAANDAIVYKWALENLAADVNRMITKLDPLFGRYALSDTQIAEREVAWARAQAKGDD